MRATALLFLTLSVACRSPAGGGIVAVAPGDQYPTGRVEVHGLDDHELASPNLRVAVATPAGVVAPAMLGTVRVEDRALVFEPRFPFDRGLDYRVTFEHADGDVTTLDFEFPRPVLESSTVVSAVYPTADVLPQNLLKFYVHFSAPMWRGEAYRHARLVDGEGEDVFGAFLRVEPELWDPDATRLTLLVEPGRVKSGFALREVLGPVLVAGRTYALEVDPGWRDARGAALAGGFRKEFRVVEPDPSSPDPKAWELELPRAGTADALRVRLDEPLDHALLVRVVEVHDPLGDELPGAVDVADGEMVWTFTPDSPWGAGLHALVVPSILEDRSGNSVGRPFEVRRTGQFEFPEGPVVVSFRIE